MAEGSAERRNWSDLRARIASGLVLASGGASAAWFGGPWLAAACGAAVVAMSYEWARMSEPRSLDQAFGFALAGSLGAVLISSWGYLWLATAWMCICAAVSTLRRKKFAEVLVTAAGALYVGLPPAIFLWLRDRGPEGRDTILAMFALIWSADIFAFFGGKLLGGPLIAGGLSPNKTWSGILTGTLAAAAAGFAIASAFYHDEAMQLLWFAIGALVGFTGLMGDLFESFLKRRFGVKDASRLIPGHGGVLDRLDSLIAATLLTGVAFAFWPNMAALLFGASR